MNRRQIQWPCAAQQLRTYVHLFIYSRVFTSRTTNVGYVVYRDTIKRCQYQLHSFRNASTRRTSNAQSVRHSAFPLATWALHRLTSVGTAMIDATSIPSVSANPTDPILNSRSCFARSTSRGSDCSRLRRKYTFTLVRQR